MMAKITLKTTHDIEVKMQKLGRKSVEICERAVYVGAGIMADQIRRNLEKNLEGSAYSTGDLEGSLGIAPIQDDGLGGIGTKVGFDGYDRKGTPNALKARAMESGTSRKPARPFVRPAIKQVRATAKKAMADEVAKEIKKIMA